MSADRPNLVALRDRRQEVIAVLTQRFSDDVLDLEEFEHRVDLAHRAGSIAELDPLIEDLNAPESTALVPTRPSADELAMIERSRPAEKTLLSVFSNVERKGEWRVPRRTHVTAIMGAGLLDFRDVILPPGVTEVHATAVMGAVEIIVPPDLAVECDGTGIMGSFQHLDRVPAVPDDSAPILRITGSAIMGALEIHTRLPGETAKQARKRRKRELKRRRKQLTDGSS